MICHGWYPCLEKEKTPASLSRRIITDLLRNEFGFDGLVMTDDLDMGAILNGYGLQDTIRLAIEAGNDLVMICHRIPEIENVAQDFGNVAARSNRSRARQRREVQENDETAARIFRSGLSQDRQRDLGPARRDPRRRTRQTTQRRRRQTFAGRNLLERFAVAVRLIRNGLDGCFQCARGAIHLSRRSLDRSRDSNLSSATREREPQNRAELTIRGLIIGVIITLVFTAANVYVGLKAALTFSTSIPAAVISMAILRNFKDATIQENNIVQTVASAAGTLSSIIFVLPGLIMIGYWTEFPFWTSFWICALGGILGVMYSIPLRRALVTNSDLPYPEGVACAEVLKVGSSGDGEYASDVEHGRAGLLAVLWGSIVSAAFRIDHRDPNIRFRCGAKFSNRKERRGQRLRFLFVIFVARDWAPGRSLGRHSDADRLADRLGLGRAALFGSGR